MYVYTATQQAPSGATHAHTYTHTHTYLNEPDRQACGQYSRDCIFVYAYALAYTYRTAFSAIAATTGNPVHRLFYYSQNNK